MEKERGDGVQEPDAGESKEKTSIGYGMLDVLDVGDENR